MQPDQLGNLYDQHTAALVLFARQWTSAAEDVVQEAFLKLVRQRPTPRDPVAWLFRVVRNQAISLQRSESRRRRREVNRLQPVCWFERADDQLDAQHATETLRELEVELRETVVARLWGQLTYEQIAEVQRCSVATVHRRYRQALQILQERLNPCNPTIPALSSRQSNDA